MYPIFGTRPVCLADGAMIVAIGAGLILLLEAEKLAFRRLVVFRELRRT